MLQFTDPHLPGTPGTLVRGIATEATLARCVAHAGRRHPDPGAVLLTGDLVHDEAAGYAALRARFQDSSAPVHCLPGNHEVTSLMRQALAGPPFVHTFATRYGNWLIVMMDSTVAGAHHGHLATEELARLDAALAAAPGTYALIGLHHHPVPHGSPWLDILMLDNASEFFDVLAQHPGVRGIVWGHTHQPFEGMHGHIRLMGTPSTCMQFTQNAEQFEVDTRPPAYRWLELEPGGGIETGVEWVGDND